LDAEARRLVRFNPCAPLENPAPLHANMRTGTCERTEYCWALRSRPWALVSAKRRFLPRNTAEPWNSRWRARPTCSVSAVVRYPTSAGSWPACGRTRRSSADHVARYSIRAPTPGRLGRKVRPNQVCRSSPHPGRDSFKSLLGFSYRHSEEPPGHVARTRFAPSVVVQKFSSFARQVHQENF